MAHSAPFPSADGPVESHASDGTLGLLRQLADDLATLLRKELALVTAEIIGAIRDAKQGIASVAAGAAVLFAGFLMLLLAVAAGLAEAMPAWLAGLIVGGATVIAGVVLLAVGKKKINPRGSRS